MAVHVEVAVSQFDEPLDWALTSIVTDGLSAVSSCVALACAGNNATVGAMSEAGTAGAGHH
jgi:hypothetical protein